MGHNKPAYTTFTSCHDDNSYFAPFKDGKILIAGSRRADLVRDADLIVNAYDPLVGYKPPPAKPVLNFSNPDFWGKLAEMAMISAKKIPAKEPDIIDIDWRDYGVPDLSAWFWRELYLLTEQIPLKEGSDTIDILFTCMGGHGRTGTAMVCYLLGSGAYDPLTAIKFVRKNYCLKAVESLEQEKYVWAVGATFLMAEKHSTEKIEELHAKYKSWCNSNVPSKTGGSSVGGYNKDGTYTNPFPKSQHQDPVLTTGFKLDGL